MITNIVQLWSGRTTARRWPDLDCAPVAIWPSDYYSNVSRLRNCDFFLMILWRTFVCNSPFLRARRLTKRLRRFCNPRPMSYFYQTARSAFENHFRIWSIYHIKLKVHVNSISVSKHQKIVWPITGRYRSLFWYIQRQTAGYDVCLVGAPSNTTSTLFFISQQTCDHLMRQDKITKTKHDTSFLPLPRV